MSILLHQKATAAVAVVADLVGDPLAFGSLSADDALVLTGLFGQLQRLTSTGMALTAGVIARHSARALGHDGLAQRMGHRTPEELIRVTTGTSLRDAQKAVRVGEMALAATEPEAASSSASASSASSSSAAQESPWLRVVGEAVAAGTLSVDAFEAIRVGLGKPSTDITADTLADAARFLLTDAPGFDSDRLLTRARDLRDELDEAGIIDRERAVHEKRSFRLQRLPDGSARVTVILDLEGAAVVRDFVDRATSPRLGGPRFVPTAANGTAVDGTAADGTAAVNGAAADGTDRSFDNAVIADRIMTDPRSTEQLLADGFVEMFRQGMNADTSQLLNTGAPVVKILVREQDLAARTGHGRIEGGPAPVSMGTVERVVCSGNAIPIVVDTSGQTLNIGRQQRHYTTRQRIALAARDGGCRWPGCDRPPAWTEAHHTRFWHRDTGPTDIADGILLCRHHHLLTHNNGWEITHQGGNYWLIPPPLIDRQQTPVPMPSKSATLHELLRT